MNFYITSEPQRRLKNAFTNIKQYKIIDVDQILDEFNMDPNDDICGFIIDEEIQKRIKDGKNSKKCCGIIYVNSQLDKTLIEKLKSLLYSMEDKTLVDITILDDFDVPKKEDLYKLVDNVLFFPILKKPKLIRCRRIDKKWNKV